MGAIVMLPHGVRELPYAPFWGFNAAHRKTVLFLLCGTALARDAAQFHIKETPPLNRGGALHWQEL